VGGAAAGGGRQAHLRAAPRGGTGGRPQQPRLPRCSAAPLLRCSMPHASARLRLLACSAPAQASPPAHAHTRAHAHTHTNSRAAPVHHHVPVAVLDAADDLLEEAPRLVLHQPPLLHDVVEQLAALRAGAARASGRRARTARARRERRRSGARGETAAGAVSCGARAVPRAHLDVLHDHVDVGGRLDHLVQADDVRVHEQPQDLDLAAHCGGGRGGGISRRRPGGGGGGAARRGAGGAAAGRPPFSSMSIAWILRRFRILIATWWPVSTCSATLTCETAGGACGERGGAAGAVPACGGRDGAPCRRSRCPASCPAGSSTGRIPPTGCSPACWGGRQPPRRPLATPPWRLCGVPGAGGAWAPGAGRGLQVAMRAPPVCRLLPPGSGGGGFRWAADGAARVAGARFVAGEGDGTAAKAAPWFSLDRRAGCGGEAGRIGEESPGARGGFARGRGVPTWRAAQTQAARAAAPPRHCRYCRAAAAPFAVCRLQWSGRALNGWAIEHAKRTQRATRRAAAHGTGAGASNARAVRAPRASLTRGGAARPTWQVRSGRSAGAVRYCAGSSDARARDAFAARPGAQRRRSRQAAVSGIGRRLHPATGAPAAEAAIALLRLSGGGGGGRSGGPAAAPSISLGAPRLSFPLPLPRAPRRHAGVLRAGREAVGGERRRRPGGAAAGRRRAAADADAARRAARQRLPAPRRRRPPQRQLRAAPAGRALPPGQPLAPLARLQPDARGVGGRAAAAAAPRRLLRLLPRRAAQGGGRLALALPQGIPAAGTRRRPAIHRGAPRRWPGCLAWGARPGPPRPAPAVPRRPAAPGRARSSRRPLPARPHGPRAPQALKWAQRCQRAAPSCEVEAAPSYREQRALAAQVSRRAQRALAERDARMQQFSVAWEGRRQALRQLSAMLEAQSCNAELSDDIRREMSLLAQVRPCPGRAAAAACASAPGRPGRGSAARWAAAAAVLGEAAR
jgi:hypothetical protein